MSNDREAKELLAASLSKYYELRDDNDGIEESETLADSLAEVAAIFPNFDPLDIFNELNYLKYHSKK